MLTDKEIYNDDDDASGLPGEGDGAKSLGLISECISRLLLASSVAISPQSSVEFLEVLLNVATVPVVRRPATAGKFGLARRDYPASLLRETPHSPVIQKTTTTVVRRINAQEHKNNPSWMSRLSNKSTTSYSEPSGMERGNDYSAAVYSDHKSCSEIGRLILLKGGNAMDAAISATICLSAALPHRGGPGAKASGVPGFLRGLHRSFERYASKKLSWRQLIEPTIQLCARGVTVSEELADDLEKHRSLILNDRKMRSQFVNYTTGKLLREGDKMFCHALSTFLTDVVDSDNPGNYFYKGTGARKSLKAFGEKEIFITENDMEDYEPDISQNSVIKAIEGSTLCGNAPPSVFSVIQLAVSAMIGANSSVKEIPLLAWDTTALIGDPDFDTNTDNIITKLLREESIKGVIRRYHDKENPSVKWEATEEGSFAVSVIDEKGNAVSMVSSIGDKFGARIFTDLGFFMNNAMKSFDYEAFSGSLQQRNSLQPAKGPRTQMSGVIAHKNGAVQFVTGGANFIRLCYAALDGMGKGRDVQATTASPILYKDGDGLHLKHGREQCLSGCGPAHRRVFKKRKDVQEVDLRALRRGPTSPLARRLKQQRVQREESRIMQEEEAERRRRRESGETTQGTKPTKQSAESSAELARRRPKEKTSLEINEGKALKEMSKMYQDLLQRFEDLRLKMDSQMRAEADSTRLRRMARDDPSVKDALHDVVQAMRKLIKDFKTCSGLAGAQLPNSAAHERRLCHIFFFVLSGFLVAMLLHRTSTVSFATIVDFYYRSTNKQKINFLFRNGKEKNRGKTGKETLRSNLNYRKSNIVAAISFYNFAINDIKEQSAEKEKQEESTMKALMQSLAYHESVRWEAIRKNLATPGCKYSSKFIGSNIAPFGLCELETGNGNLTTLVVGNSFACNQADMVHNAFKRLYSNFYVFCLDTCEVLSITDDELCKTRVDYIDIIKDLQPNLVFILDRKIAVKKVNDTKAFNNDFVFMQHLYNLVSIEQVADKVFILEPLPSCELSCGTLALDFMMKGNRPLRGIGSWLISKDDKYARMRHKELRKRCRKCELIDYLPVLKNDDGVYRGYDRETNIMYLDESNHLNKFGKQRVQPLFDRLAKRVEAELIGMEEV
ncbi:unnamed protein product [Nippostrongylus brasiliensis]|uniref:SGNH domain-containing protein n=1 Tax=Nippostrongylus brasiliensis TaxID=27835 RepID=A0A158QZA6_NIPBR|nr:unnamed protein product [Nippostrongylus brasiliensis]